MKRKLDRTDITILLSAATLFVLCMTCSCKGTDAQPDEFRVDVGHGESDFNNTARTGMESTYGSVGLTWYIGDNSERQARERAYEEYLWSKPVPAPTTIPEPVAPTPTATEAPVSHPEAGVSETPHDQPKPFEPKMLLPYLVPLILGVAAAMAKKEH